MSADSKRPDWLRYEELVDAIPGGVLAFDDKGVVVYASTKTASILGVSRAGILGQSLGELTGNEWSDVCNNELACAKKGEQVCYDFRFSASWVQISLSPVLEKGRIKGAVGVLSDIGAERGADRKLREAESRINHATVNMPGVMYELRYSKKDGLRLQFVSGAAKKYTGMDAETLMDKQVDMRSLLHPEDVPKVMTHVAEVARTLQPSSLQFRMVNGDEIFHVFTSASIVKDENGSYTITGIAIDIGELNAMESRLRVSQAQLHAVFENFPFECWSLDLQGRFLLQNPSNKERWGDLIGQSMSEVVLPDYMHIHCHADIGKAMQGTVARRETTTVIDGQQRHIERLVVPMFDGTELFGVLGVIVDKTDERAFEKQLAESKKLDAIGRLAGGVAHDFNNILTAIMSCVRLLERRLDGPPRRELQIIREGAGRAAKLTRQLLSFAKQEQVEATRHSVDDVLEKCDRLLRRLIGEGIQLETEKNTNGIEVLVDPLRMEQAIINLVVNAKDSMSEGGTILIRSEAIVLNSYRESVDGAIPPGEYALISVQDTGAGMNEDTEARAFEPFFTTRHEQGGTGLGLSSVYGSVHQAGGFVTLETELGKGTKIGVYLPRAGGRVLGTASSGTASLGIRFEDDDFDETSRPKAGGRTILLVEDEPMILSVACRSLRLNGHKVLVAETPEEALRLSAKREGAIDLLLTDVMLPTIDGPSLSAQIRERRPGIAVLFMSGYSLERIDLKGQDADFLAKPFTPEQLERGVRNAMERQLHSD